MQNNNNDANINNTLRFEPDTTPNLRHNNRSEINYPRMFTDATNFVIWLKQLEMYLENCCDKNKWFDTAFSYISPSSLSDIFNINELRHKSDNYTHLTEFLRKKYTKKETYKHDFSNGRQTAGKNI